MAGFLSWLSATATSYGSPPPTPTPTPTPPPKPARRPRPPPPRRGRQILDTKPPGRHRPPRSPPPSPPIWTILRIKTKNLTPAELASEWHTLIAKKDTGNKISRRSQIHGTHHITLGGKSIIMADAVVRGDLFRASSSSSSSSKEKEEGGGKDGKAANPAQNIAISIGRYSFISRSAILRPPSRLTRGVHTYTTLHIGHHVFVGERSIIEAAKVEDNVTIGKDCVVGSMVILKERCQVLDGAVVPANMVVPSYCIVAGQPARIIGEVAIAYGVEGMEGGMGRERYRSIR